MLVLANYYRTIVLMIKRAMTLLLAATLCIATSSTAFAEDTPQSKPTENNVIITELQTNGEGTGTTLQEFIELYNPLSEPVNMLGWSVVYKNSTGKETVVHTFTEPFLLLPSSYMIGKNEFTVESYLPDVLADFTYSYGSSGLAATAGSVMIKNQTDIVVDELAWVNTMSFIDNNTLNGLIGGMSAQRKCDAEQYFIDTNTVANDYFIGLPTPLSATCLSPSEDTQDNSQTDTIEPLVPVEQKPPATAPRMRLPLLINELFIDPIAPLTDSKDEFVEITNHNETAVDISGYTITAGTTTKYKYTFPSGSIIGPNGYLSITSAATTIALTNSGGTVQLADDLGTVVDSVQYTAAVPGAAWARNNAGTWQWTTAPTNGSANVIIPPPQAQAKTKKTSASAAKKKSTKKTTKKKTNFSVAPPIQINEVFPDPKSPQTDAKDEFIELYNPHPTAINITDYTISAGATRKYTYTFPEGSVILPQSYIVVGSDSTSLSLTNSGATVQLINNFDKEIDTVTYDKAISGQSYARDDFGKWQWTSTVTKNEKNIITASASKKSSKTSVAGIVAGTDSKPLAPAPQPLPTWVLAMLGFGAVCYAAYEYRFEARNIFYKFKAHSTAR